VTALFINRWLKGARTGSDIGTANGMDALTAFADVTAYRASACQQIGALMSPKLLISLFAAVTLFAACGKPADKTGETATTPGATTSPDTAPTPPPSDMPTDTPTNPTPADAPPSEAPSGETPPPAEPPKYIGWLAPGVEPGARFALPGCGRLCRRCGSAIHKSGDIVDSCEGIDLCRGTT